MMKEKLRLTLAPEEIEQQAMEQIEAALSLPFLKGLAIMPDVHAGYALPIGGVALLDDFIWPAAVGYDIGCGMCHIATGLPLQELPPMEEVYRRLCKLIPAGFSVHEKPVCRVKKFPNALDYAALGDAVFMRGALQMGTLGSGNHFIEIGVNSRAEAGITIHSGSRRPGYVIADFYMRQTRGAVPVGSDQGQAYLTDMNWALEFALDNRKMMMRKCLTALGLDVEQQMQGMINENHNHAEVTPDGVLHRKGATPAQSGQPGVIPANMRDGVFITRGLGNTEFFSSASHGAGRTMSRTRARKTLNKKDLQQQMQGIITPDLQALLDEAPGAYKDIDAVIGAQDGLLVDIVDHFKPVLVLKGC